MSTPDLSTLTSSEQIFSNNTLPQIRAIHKNLHVQIDEKASRLRTQVGGSYRELLGTADTIVRMRGENDQVQELLGRIGARCGRTVIDNKASGLEGFLIKQKRPEVTRAARLKLLEACGLAVRRILKGGGGLSEDVSWGDRLVLATKVWVLSRLLTKSLSDEAKDETARAAVEAAAKKTQDLRRRLSQSVDKVLEQSDEGIDREDILKALSAYSLANNSGVRDVLHHFLRVRAAAMAVSFDIEEGIERERSTEDVVQSMTLYTRTILDVQALVPTRLSQALSGLKKQPLLDDPALHQLEGLRLDIYERWCGDDMQLFTPFIRHDELDGKQAREMLTSWSKKGGQVLLDGMKKTLDHMADFKSIMELRTRVLQLWIRDGGRARGFDPLEMQDDLREVINTRMLAALDGKVGKLHLVGSELKATMESWQAGITKKHGGLWDEDGYDEALENGAAPFVQEVVSRLFGRNDAVSRALNCYSSWRHVMDEVKGVVESLKEQRWDNDYDEIEDEDTLKARQQLLSKEDPELLETRLARSLDTAYVDLEGNIKELWGGHSGSKNSSAVALYLLRVIRDIRSELPERPGLQRFGLSLVPKLHQELARSVLAPVVDGFSETGLAERKVLSRSLWEGEPPLPTQPSPGTFHFLRDLAMAMGDVGVDLWSPAAVKTLKQQLTEQLCPKWTASLDTLSKQTNGEPNKGEEDQDESEDAPSSADQTKDLMVQWLYDISYLRCSLGDEVDSVQKLNDAISKKAEMGSNASQEQIVKSANDYWQRTKLLFGPLA